MKHMQTVLIALGGVVVAAAGYAGGYVTPRPAHAHAAVAADCSHGYVALTFDDGPDPVSTPQLLTALKRAGIRATFFDIGEQVHKYPALVTQTVADGNQVDDHTWDHKSLTGATTGTSQLPDVQVTAELDQAKQAIIEVIGRHPAFFRSPYGDTDARVQALAQPLAMTEVGWTVDSRDFEGVSTEQIVRNVLSVQPGGVVVLHDAGKTPNTIAAIPAIAAGLDARGLCAGRLAPSKPGTAGWEHGVFHARPVKW